MTNASNQLRRRPGLGVVMGIAGLGLSWGVAVLLFWLPPVALIFVLAGLVLPFLLPFLLKSAPCPNCEREVVVHTKPGVNCPRCKHALGVKDGQLVDYSRVAI